MAADSRRVAVVTDGAASLPPGVCDALGVGVVPMSVMIGNTVREDQEVAPADVVESAGRDLVTTSAPSPGDYLRTLEELGDRPVVIATVARRMSASYDAAMTAARYVPQRRVAVVDTETAAGGQGLVVMAAAQASRAGGSHDDVTAAARGVIRRVRLLAFLDQLDYLARSGRVPDVAARAGQSLGMRAVFEFSGGRVRGRLPARSTDAAVARIMAACRAGRSDGARLHAAVVDAKSPHAAESLMTAVRRLSPDGEVYAAPFSSVMVAHTGPGVAGLAWWWEPTRPAAATDPMPLAAMAVCDLRGDRDHRDVGSRAWHDFQPLVAQ